MSSVDTFIERAEKIYNNFKKAPALAHKAQREGRALLKQFEKDLKAKGLEAPARVKRNRKLSTTFSRQRRSSA